MRRVEESGVIRGARRRRTGGLLWAPGRHGVRTAGARCLPVTSAGRTRGGGFPAPADAGRQDL